MLLRSGLRPIAFVVAVLGGGRRCRGWERAVRNSRCRSVCVNSALSMVISGDEWPSSFMSAGKLTPNLASDRAYYESVPRNPSFCDPKFAKLGNTVVNAESGRPNHEDSVAPY